MMPMRIRENSFIAVLLSLLSRLTRVGFTGATLVAGGSVQPQSA